MMVDHVGESKVPVKYLKVSLLYIDSSTGSVQLMVVRPTAVIVKRMAGVLPM